MKHNFIIGNLIPYCGSLLFYRDIIHEPCECLLGYNCHTNHRKLIKLRDEISGVCYNLYICKEYIRQEIQKPFPYQDSTMMLYYKDLIENIIFALYRTLYPSLKIEQQRFNIDRDILDIAIPIQLSESPKIYGCITMINIIKYVLSDDLSIYGKFDERLKAWIVRQIMRWYAQKEGVKKYEKIRRLIAYKTRLDWHISDENMLALFAEILESYRPCEIKRKGSLPLNTIPTAEKPTTDIAKRNLFLQQLKATR